MLNRPQAQPRVQVKSPRALRSSRHSRLVQCKATRPVLENLEDRVCLSAMANTLFYLLLTAIRLFPSGSRSSSSRRRARQVSTLRDVRLEVVQLEVRELLSIDLANNLTGGSTRTISSGNNVAQRVTLAQEGFDAAIMEALTFRVSNSDGKSPSSSQFDVAIWGGYVRNPYTGETTLQDMLVRTTAVVFRLKWHTGEVRLAVSREMSP